MSNFVGGITFFAESGDKLKLKGFNRFTISFSKYLNKKIVKILIVKMFNIP